MHPERDALIRTDAVLIGSVGEEACGGHRAPRCTRLDRATHRGVQSKVIDIDDDPELRARFDLLVPVVECDGEIRFKGRIDETLLRRLIEGTSPIQWPVTE